MGLVKQCLMKLMSNKGAKMTLDETIKELEILKAWIEWDYPLEMQLALDKAIHLLKEQNKDG